MKTSNYWKPTPKKLRMLGDALLSTGTFAGTFAITQEQPWIGATIFIVCVAAKFITNFFKEDEPQNTAQ